MKTNNTNNHSSYPHFHPNDDMTGDEGSPQHWVNAETMFRVRDNSDTDYETWISSLTDHLASCESCELDRPARMLISSDKAHYLNEEFAAYLEENTRRDFFGAITMAVLKYRQFDPMYPNPNWDVRDLIKSLEALEIDSMVDADVLYDLLGVETDYSFWFTLLIESFGMEYWRDVKAWIDGVLHEGTSFPDDTWKHKCYLSVEFATKVAMATPTIRGMLFHKFIKGDKRPTIQSETPGGDEGLVPELRPSHAGRSPL